VSVGLAGEAGSKLRTAVMGLSSPGHPERFGG
jgi:hypothetical protein